MPVQFNRTSGCLKGEAQRSNKINSNLHCVHADCSSAQHSTSGGLADPEICTSRRQSRVLDRHLHIQAPRQVAATPFGFPPALSCLLSLPGCCLVSSDTAQHVVSGDISPLECNPALCQCFLLMHCTFLQDEGVSGELHSWSSHAQGGCWFCMLPLYISTIITLLLL